MTNTQTTARKTNRYFRTLVALAAMLAAMLVASGAALAAADTTAPSVTSTSPQPGAFIVDTSANVKATFSEGMKASTVNGTTFKLFKKGSTTRLGASVSYDATAHTAMLDPTKLAQDRGYLQGGDHHRCQ
jgi:anti-sigma factor RsiW